MASGPARGMPIHVYVDQGRQITQFTSALTRTADLPIRIRLDQDHRLTIHIRFAQDV